MKVELSFNEILCEFEERIIILIKKLL